MLLTREQIIQAQDLQSEDVEVAEWGGRVRVRMMTGLQRDALSAALIGPGNKPDLSTYRVRLVAACIVGEDGNPLFGPDEIAALGAKSGVALDRVYRVAERLNDTAPQAVEALQGN